MGKRFLVMLAFLLIVSGFSVFTPQVVAKEAPVANDDTYSVNEDTVLFVLAPGVLDNDYDPDGDPLTVELVIGPNDGSMVFDPDGSFIYTPNPNFNGADVFTYMAYDGEYYSNVAVVTITVIPVNDAPVADVGSDQVVEEGDLASFDGWGDDVDGTVESYEWDFGDGSPNEYGISVSHVYADDGAYAVTLVVTMTKD